MTVGERFWGFIVQEKKPHYDYFLEFSSIWIE